MLAEEIIAMFELQLDDTSELSTTEEYALMNRIYKKVCRQRPWEFLRTPKTGTLSASVPYVALPDDFAFMAENAEDTDSSTSRNGNAVSKVVYVGTARRPYQVINYADREARRNQDGYCYIDIVNSRLVFTLQPTAADSYEYDYICIPADLEEGDQPVFKVAHEIIAYGMATEGFIIQLFDKARSYAGENRALYQEAMDELAYWNANLRAD